MSQCLGDYTPNAESADGALTQPPICDMSFGTRLRANWSEQKRQTGQQAVSRLPETSHSSVQSAAFPSTVRWCGDRRRGRLPGARHTRSPTGPGWPERARGFLCRCCRQPHRLGWADHRDTRGKDSKATCCLAVEPGRPLRPVADHTAASIRLADIVEHTADGSVPDRQSLFFGSMSRWTRWSSGSYRSGPCASAAAR